MTEHVVSNVVIHHMPMVLVPALRELLSRPEAVAAGCTLDLRTADENSLPDALTRRERRALMHPANHANAERLEQLLWEGMATPEMHTVVTTMLQPTTIPFRPRFPAAFLFAHGTTELLCEARTLKACADQLLINKERHGLGADAVLLVRGSDEDEPGRWYLHLFLLKAGTVLIRNIKSTCGRRNESRCTYYITKHLQEIGDQLSMLLRLQFPASPRGRRPHDQTVVTTIHCVHHLLTLSPLSESARKDLHRRGVRVYESAAVYALLPERVRLAYELVDHHFERREEKI